MSICRTLLCIKLSLVLVIFFWIGCSSNGNPGKDSNTTKPHDTTIYSEAGACYPKRPPTIYDCEKPPNDKSKTRYWCRCLSPCGGGAPVAACDMTIGDCRWFVDDCYPQSYESCGPHSSYFTLGKCRECFFYEAGIGKDPPEQCDKLPKSDSGL